MVKKYYYILALFVFCHSLIFAQSNIDNNLSRYFKALNYMQNNIQDSAIYELNFCRNDIQCQILKGRIYFETGDYSNAIAVFKALSEKETRQSSWFLSLIYAEIGFAEESVYWLNKYFENKTPLFYSQIITNKEFENINKSYEWKDFWSERRYSKDYEKLEEINYLINNNKHAEAISALENIKSSSISFLKNYYYALSYNNVNDNGNAKKYIELSIESNSNFIKSNELKLKIEKNNKDYKNCSKTIDKLIELDRYNPRYLVEKAEVCYYLKDYNIAEKYITGYVNYFPNDETAQYLKVQILISSKKPLEALKTLNTLIEISPLKSEYFEQRANIHYDFENWELARKDYSMALDISPNNPEVNYKTGMCYYNQNKLEKACHYCEKAANAKHRKAAEFYYGNCGK